MAARKSQPTTDPGVAALKVAMALRQWERADLAKALGVSPRYVGMQFQNDFSSKAMRVRVNKVFGKQVFFEGIGEA